MWESLPSLNLKMKRFLPLSLALFALAPFALSQQEDQFKDEFFGVGFGNSGRGSLYYGRRNGSLGFQLGVYNSTNFDQNQLADGPPPLDTQFLGRYRTIPGFGIDVLGFFGNEYQSFVAGVGIYDQALTSVGRSPSTTLMYQLGDVHVFRGAFSVGFRASTGNSSDFGFGYHTLLGWNLAITVRH